MSPLLAIWQLAFELVPHPIGHLGVLGVGVGVLLAVPTGLVHRRLHTDTWRGRVASTIFRLEREQPLHPDAVALRAHFNGGDGAGALFWGPLLAAGALALWAAPFAVLGLFWWGLDAAPVLPWGGLDPRASLVAQSAWWPVGLCAVWTAGWRLPEVLRVQPEERRPMLVLLGIAVGTGVAAMVPSALIPLAVAIRLPNRLSGLLPLHIRRPPMPPVPQRVLDHEARWEAEQAQEGGPDDV